MYCHDVSLNENCVFNAIKRFYVQSKKQCKIGHINVNSIRHKIEPFRHVLTENVLDILTIQETKLDNSFPDNQFYVDRYKLYRQDFKGNEGGIMMYIRDDFPHRRRLDIENHGFNNHNGRIEILALEATINNSKWFMISVYKQPKVKVTHLINCVESIMDLCMCDNLNSTVVIMGDLNVDMLKPNSLNDCFDVYGLKNLIKESTCNKGTPSLLDLIVTNQPKRFQNSVSAETGLSDFHSLVCVSTKLNVPQNKCNTFKYRSFKHFNNDKFLYDLSVIPYNVIEVFDDIDDSYWMWHELTMDVINSHAPIKTKTIKGHRVPYMNGELRRAINVRNMLKRKYEKCKDNVQWKLSLRLGKEVLQNIYKRNVNNTRGFWDTVRKASHI